MKMTTGGWVMLALDFLCAIGGVVLATWAFLMGLTGVAISILILMGLLAVTLIISPIVQARANAHLRPNESYLKRAYREITLYSTSGQILEQYAGVFELRTDNSTYILFKDDKGSWHRIYHASGILSIKEKAIGANGAVPNFLG